MRRLLIIACALSLSAAWSPQPAMWISTPSIGLRNGGTATSPSCGCALISFAARKPLPVRMMAGGGAKAPMGNILVLDHLNINHKKGRHDLLKSFYFDVLGCACDPRKEDNLATGKKTLWANTGIQQFHLPEEDEPQVFAGTITLHYPSLAPLRARLSAAPAALEGTHFEWTEAGPDALQVTCPWGNRFMLQSSEAFAMDSRGSQPGPPSEPVGMPELRVHVQFGANMEGIARFYNQVMKAPVEMRPSRVSKEPRLWDVVVHCGHGQELIFEEMREGCNVEHSDYHISMYISDLPATFGRANDLGLVFVNPRFTRQAHTLEEAIDQCMFRVRDIVDPHHPSDGPILLLEHEIRSTVNKDGTPYKSCPFDA